MRVRNLKDGTTKVYFHSPKDDHIIDMLTQEAGRTGKTLDDVFNNILRSMLGQADKTLKKKTSKKKSKTKPKVR